MDTQNQVPLDIRQEAFRQLVELQDSGTPVAKSRDEVGTRYSLSADQVQTIEREGLNESWPPLS